MIIFLAVAISAESFFFGLGVGLLLGSVIGGVWVACGPRRDSSYLGIVDDDPDVSWEVRGIHGLPGKPQEVEDGET